MQYTSFTSQKTTRMKRHPLYESKSISPSSLRLLTSHIQQDHPRFRHHKHQNAHPPRRATSHHNHPAPARSNQPLQPPRSFENEPPHGFIFETSMSKGSRPKPLSQNHRPFHILFTSNTSIFNPLDKPLLYKRIQHKKRCNRDKRCCHLVRFIDLERASGRGCHTVKLRVKQTEL